MKLHPSLRSFCSPLYSALLYYIHRHRSILFLPLSLCNLTVHQHGQIAFTCFANRENRGRMRKLENKTEEDIRKPEWWQASLPFHHIAAQCTVVIVHGLEKRVEAFEHNGSWFNGWIFSVSKEQINKLSPKDFKCCFWSWNHTWPSFFCRFLWTFSEMTQLWGTGW